MQSLSTDTYVFNMDASRQLSDSIQELNADSSIEWAEPDYQLVLNATMTAITTINGTSIIAGKTVAPWAWT